MKTLKNASFLFSIVILIACATSKPAGAEAVYKKQLDAGAGGFGVLTVTASTPGFRWVMPEPAPVLDVLLDGKFLTNLVLFGGDQPFAYKLLTGNLEAGPHSLEIRRNAKRASTVGYEINDVSLDVAAKGTPEFEAYQYAPLLYGREENDISDVPLLMWVEVSRNKNGGSVFQYSYVWTNEDGGTQTASLMARYGRSVDIEYCIAVSVDAAGNVTRELFQTFKHNIVQFNGRHDGKRPVLLDATTNNIFADVGKTSLMFSYAPMIMPPLPDVRETVIDANPWIVRISAEEMEKEGKLVSNGEGTDLTKTADPRTYVYVDLNSDTMLTSFKADIGVKLKGGEWHTSAHGIADLGLDLPGWQRVAVPVGVIPKPEDLDSIRVSLMAAQTGGGVVLRGVKRLVVLDSNFTPHIIPIDWTGKVLLSPAKPQWVRAAHADENH